MKNFFTHWKTSLLGFGGAVLIQAAQGTSWKTIAASLISAVYGAVSADASVTTPSVGPVGKMALLLGLMFALPFNAHAQTPDAAVPFTFTNTTTHSTTGTLDNRQLGCTNWTIVYVNTGFSAVNVLFESAPGSVTAGTFVNFAGTTVTGANPGTNTAFTVSTFTGYVPWYRMSLSSATGTGTVKGIVYCRRATNAAGPPTTGNGNIPTEYTALLDDSAGNASGHAEIKLTLTDGVNWSNSIVIGWNGGSKNCPSACIFDPDNYTFYITDPVSGNILSSNSLAFVSNRSFFLNEVLAGNVTGSNYVKTGKGTVAGSLGTCNSTIEAQHKAVTNALAPVALAPVVGGGTAHVSVYCNGTTWIVE